MQETRRKADELTRERGIGDEHGRVTGSARGMHERDGMAGDALDRRDDAAHRGRLASTEIERERNVAGIEVAQPSTWAAARSLTWMKYRSQVPSTFG
jgi:hypothetical protein